jgi:hypothetical protein
LPLDHPDATIPSAVSAVEKIELAALRRDIAVGAKQMDGGHYRTYTDENIRQLAEDVCRGGRERLARIRKIQKQK